MMAIRNHFKGNDMSYQIQPTGGGFAVVCTVDSRVVRVVDVRRDPEDAARLARDLSRMNALFEAATLEH